MDESRTGTNDTITINNSCPFCGAISSTTVDLARWNLWKTTLPIQVAFPELTDQERESLKTGICAQCWDEM